MQLKRHLAGSVLWLAVWSFQGAHANDKPQSSDPELRSHHPLGGSIGTPFEIRVRGKRLPGTHTVWFECDDVQARVLAVKEIAETGELDEDQYYRKRTLALLGQDGQEPEFLAVLEVLTSPDTRPGLHHFRLVGPTGLSNSLSLHLVDQPLQNEEKSPHHRPSQGPGTAPPGHRQRDHRGQGRTGLLLLRGGGGRDVGLPGAVRIRAGRQLLGPD